MRTGVQKMLTSPSRRDPRNAPVRRDGRHRARSLYRVRSATTLSRLAPSPDQVVVGLSLIQLARLSRAITTAPSKSSAQAVAVRVHEIILTTHAKYFERTIPNVTPLQGAAAHKARFHIVTNRLRLAQACLDASGLHDQVVLADAMVQGGEVVACFEDAVDTILLYVQDTIALEMLRFGQWIGRVSTDFRAHSSHLRRDHNDLCKEQLQIFPQVTTSYQTTLVSYLTRIYLAATRALREHGGEVGGFISRFFRGALRALHPEGVPMTRPPSPSAASKRLDPGEVGNTTNGSAEAAVIGPFDQLNGIVSFRNSFAFSMSCAAADQNRTSRSPISLPIWIRSLRT